MVNPETGPRPEEYPKGPNQTKTEQEAKAAKEEMARARAEASMRSKTGEVGKEIDEAGWSKTDAEDASFIQQKREEGLSWAEAQRALEAKREERKKQKEPTYIEQGPGAGMP